MFEGRVDATLSQRVAQKNPLWSLEGDPRHLISTVTQWTPTVAAREWTASVWPLYVHAILAEENQKINPGQFISRNPDGDS